MEDTTFLYGEPSGPEDVGAAEMSNALADAIRPLVLIHVWPYVWPMHLPISPCIVFWGSMGAAPSSMAPMLRDRSPLSTD